MISAGNHYGEKIYYQHKDGNQYKGKIIGMIMLEVDFSIQKDNIVKAIEYYKDGKVFHAHVYNKNLTLR